jgi:hypothetical protein
LRKATIPIDMSSEQKEILGIISKRQLIYIVAGGALIYAYIPYVFKLVPHFLFGFIFSVISALPVVATVIVLGFLKKSKLHLHFDHYFLIKMGYKNQIGIWRKGRHPKQWMVNK